MDVVFGTAAVLIVLILIINVTASSFFRKRMLKLVVKPMLLNSLSIRVV